MNENDPLSRLLKNWQPQSPYGTEQIAQNVMRLIRQRQTEPLWKRLGIQWAEFLSDWLPSPNVLVPVAASIILFVGALQLTLGVREAKSLAALQWQEQLSNPLAKASLTGSYAQFVKQK